MQARHDTSMVRIGKFDLNSERAFLWVCLVPVLVFLAIVAVAPTTAAIIDSFRELSLVSFAARGEFIGFENYRELLSEDGKFFTAVWHTCLFVVVVVPIEFCGGLAIALWINREFRGRRLILSLIMIPTVIAPIVVGLIWHLFFLPTFGLFTQGLNDIGLFRDTGVFSTPESALAVLMLIDIWEWTPFVMLILLAGLTAMPKAPIEAAHHRWRHPAADPLVCSDSAASPAYRHCLAAALHRCQQDLRYGVRADWRGAGRFDRDGDDLCSPHELHDLEPGLRCGDLPGSCLRFPGHGGDLLQDRGEAVGNP